MTGRLKLFFVRRTGTRQPVVHRRSLSAYDCPCGMQKCRGTGAENSKVQSFGPVRCRTAPQHNAMTRHRIATPSNSHTDGCDAIPMPRRRQTRFGALFSINSQFCMRSRLAIASKALACDGMTARATCNHAGLTPEPCEWHSWAKIRKLFCFCVG